ncbi:MAG TPA: DUF2975 domain-containing protein [Vicinamibacterales bacterium]|jgi:hypothetical protein
MERPRNPRALAAGLAALFTVLWWWVLVGTVVLGGLVLTRVLDVRLQIGPNGEPNFAAGRDAQMVLPVAFDLDGATAQVTSIDRHRAGAIERGSGLLRLAAPDRPWVAVTAVAAMTGLTLWVLAELAALCRAARDGQPFAPANAGRIRRLGLAFVLAELCRAFIVYGAHAYAASHFAADHLRFTASPHLNALSIVSALILFVLAEAFRTGTRLDEDQSLTV